MTAELGYFPEATVCDCVAEMEVAISGALAKGDSVTLLDFGTFSVSKRAVRTGRNPQTGKEIKIGANKFTKFKAGSNLAAAVN